MTAKTSFPWIIDARTDLLWLIGGAWVSWALWLLQANHGIDPVVLWFVFLVLLDSPHFFGTYLRTYLDRSEWGRRGKLLAGSLLLFAVGPIAACAGRLPLLVLSAFVPLWAYWHIVRQHLGVMMLYQRKHGDQDATDNLADMLLVYTGLIAPFLVFILHHPEASDLMGRPVGRAPEACTLAACLMIGAAATFFIVRQLWRIRLGLPLNVPKILLIFSVLTLHISICFSQLILSAPLLVFIVLVTTFHDVQYHALVWSAQRRRTAEPRGLFGVSRWASGSLWKYLTAACAMGLGLGFLGCRLEIIPGCMPLVHASRITCLPGVTLQQILHGIFLGFLMHHYYLDQHIWHPSRDERLRVELDLPQQRVKKGRLTWTG